MNPTMLRRWWPLAGVAVLLVLAAAVAPHASLRISRANPPVEDAPGLPENPPDQLPPSFPPEPRDAPASNQAHLPDWIATLAATLCVIAVLTVVGLLLFTLIRDILRRRSRPLPVAETKRASAPAAEEVVAALDAGLVDLSDADADPRRAVIACWVRLEQAAAAAGTSRQVGDTPTDLVTRLLRGHSASARSERSEAAQAKPGGAGMRVELASPTVASERPAIVSADVLAAFAQVYREARYATHTVDERMRAEARSALQRLRAELTAGAGS